MKILTLAVGMVAGAVLTHWWRPILKETLRAGIKALAQEQKEMAA